MVVHMSLQGRWYMDRCRHAKIINCVFATLRPPDIEVNSPELSLRCLPALVLVFFLNIRLMNNIITKVHLDFFLFCRITLSGLHAEESHVETVLYNIRDIFSLV